MQVDDSNGKTTLLNQSLYVRGAWKYVLTISWAMWWGGLSFYAIVVVPIGTEQFGSVGQGFVTQQVTQWHNVMSLLILVCTSVEAYRSQSRILWMFAVGLLLISVGLFGWHHRLTQMMDFKEQSVPSDFYSQHAVYLWITAAQWGLGLALPVWLLDRSK